MSFANFVFYPLVIATIVAFIIEQIFRSQDKAPEIKRSMAVRKYFWRQAWLFNIIWFVGYFILLIVVDQATNNARYDLAGVIMNNHIKNTRKMYYRVTKSIFLKM